MSDVTTKCTKIDFCSAGELTALLRSPSWNKGDLLLREGETCREGTVRTGKGRQEEGERTAGREGKRGRDPRVYL